jgi:CrcB protein
VDTPPRVQVPTLRAAHTRRLLLAVAIGGAVGASARWGIAELLPYQPGTIGWATLVVNVVGSMLIGLSARRIVPDTALWAGVVTGGLGGFTTVSAFARELDDLFAAGRTGLGLTYAAGTVLVGWLAVALAAGDAFGDRAGRLGGTILGTSAAAVVGDDTLDVRDDDQRSEP